MNKSLLKRILGVAATLSATIAVGGGTAFAALNAERCSNRNKFESTGLKKQEQIIEDLELFQNADHSYINKTNKNAFNRLGNNGAGNKIPLIVSNSFTSSELSEIKETIEEYNDLMSHIDSKYIYQLVLPGANSEIKSDVKVNLSSREIEGKGTGGFTSSVPNSNVYDFQTDVEIIIDPNKTFTKDERENRLEEGGLNFIEALKHELLHAVGLDDVYGVNNYSTFLKVDLCVNKAVNMYTPTDVSNLCLLYYNKHREGSLENKNAKVEEIKSFLENYRQEYLEAVHNNFNKENSKIEDFGTLTIELKHRKIYNQEIILSNGKYKQIFTNTETGEQKTFENFYTKIGKTIYLNNYRFLNEDNNFNSSSLGYITNSRLGLVTDPNNLENVIFSNHFNVGRITNDFYEQEAYYSNITAEITNFTQTQNALVSIKEQISSVQKNIKKVKNKISQVLTCQPNKYNLKKIGLSKKPKERQIEL